MLSQPVYSKGDQSWVFFGRNDAKAETSVLWPRHVKSWLTGKDSDAVRDWGQEEKGTTEDEMAGWHHWLDGRESEWTPGVGDGQGGLACCDSRGRRVGHDWATELNWTELNTQRVLPFPFCFSPISLSQTLKLPYCHGDSGNKKWDHNNKNQLWGTFLYSGRSCSSKTVRPTISIFIFSFCGLWPLHLKLMVKIMARGPKRELARSKT